LCDDKTRPENIFDADLCWHCNEACVLLGDYHGPFEEENEEETPEAEREAQVRAEREAREEREEDVVVCKEGLELIRLLEEADYIAKWEESMEHARRLVKADRNAYIESAKTLMEESNRMWREANEEYHQNN
jgi:hypothetical protein